MGLVLAAVAAGWLTGLGVHGGYGSHVAPALVMIGLGVGAVVTTAFSLGPAGARPADSGVAAALVNSSNQVGGSLGAALLKHHRCQRPRPATWPGAGRLTARWPPPCTATWSPSPS